MSQMGQNNFHAQHHGNHPLKLFSQSNMANQFGASGPNPNPNLRFPFAHENNLSIIYVTPEKPLNTFGRDKVKNTKQN